MLYTLEVKISWDNADGTIGVHETMQGIRAVSRTNALNKGVQFGYTLPCVSDRLQAGQRVEIEISLAKNQS